MFGCLRRVGCLVLLALIGAAAYVTRSTWMDRFRAQRSDANVRWEPSTQASDSAARRRVKSLGDAQGPVYANVSAAEISALVQREAQRRQPGVLSDVAVALVRDEIRLRGTVDLSRLRGLEEVGLLRSVLHGPRRIDLVGVPIVVSPGRGEVMLRSATIGGVSLPASVLEQVVDRFGKPQESRGVSRVTFPVPAYIGDVRVANGRLTLYKRVP